MTRRNYVTPNNFSKDEATRAFATNNPEKIIDAILGIVNGADDYEWVLESCLKFVNHPDKWVANAANHGLGNIARIYKTLDKGKVLPILEKLKLRADIAAAVEDALDDIQMFAKD